MCGIKIDTLVFEALLFLINIGYIVKQKRRQLECITFRLSPFTLLNKYTNFSVKIQMKFFFVLN